MKNKLSPYANAEINKMVARIAQKAGYAASSKDDDLFGGAKKKGGLFSSLGKSKRSAADQFSMEMKDFLLDWLESLMQQGYSEEQALLATQEKFNNSTLSESLNEFFKEHGGLDMERENRYGKSIGKGEVVTMFYVAFAIIGLGLGALIGKLTDIQGTGILAGLAIGVGMGIVSHGIVILESMDKNK